MSRGSVGGWGVDVIAGCVLNEGTLTTHYLFFLPFPRLRSFCLPNFMVVGGYDV